MIGPLLIVIGATVAGALTAGWAGALAAGFTGLFLVGAVAAGAALWATRIGTMLDPGDAWEVAPRPPLFGGLVDAVYRRTLETGAPQE
ncbi:MAG: hypothetical protein KJ698_09275 [Actinobacteria bacterium]|nr:hypothetical protein [Actinomycetota bacterium]MBU1494861.1 hypothetical protein [Actinomycetota bacterium]MBU1866212.1 hypothetical protein [Actinomycetota bacterium]